MIIDKSHPNFKRLYFACLAVSKAALAPTLGNVLVEKSRIIGCDGSRVHITEGEVGPDIEPGQYLPAKVAKSQIFLEPVANPGNYPDIDAVVPGLKELETIDLLALFNSHDFSRIDQNYVRLVRPGVARCFDHKHVVDMLIGADFQTAHLDPESNIKAVLFKGKCGKDITATGLLMPMRRNV